MADPLKECPGCGGTDIRVIGGPGTRGGPQYWVGCDHCRWRTWGNTEAEAIEAWNNRHGAGDAEDAARYRWLRANAVYGRMETDRSGFALKCYEPESEWDDAIDADRAGERG